MRRFARVVSGSACALWLFLLSFSVLSCSVVNSPVLLPTTAATAAPPTFTPTPPRPITPSHTPPAVASNTPDPVETEVVESDPPPTETPTPPRPITPSSTPADDPTATPETADSDPSSVLIVGRSSQDRPIRDFVFGDGPDVIFFIGGIHGGYEWNTILLAYEAIDYFEAHPEAIPDAVTLHVIPSANPDGQFLVTGTDGRFAPEDVAANSFPGRFNGNEVDLNRNWDCNWTADALWRDQPIDAGAHPFSEPENVALREFLLDAEPAAVIFWHSAADGVYAAGCPMVYRPSYALAAIYGLAAGYPVYESFDVYHVTGDAGDWLALQGIPSISVELVNHQDLDWEKNLAGMTAVLEDYGRIGE